MLAVENQYSGSVMSLSVERACAAVHTMIDPLSGAGGAGAAVANGNVLPAPRM